MKPGETARLAGYTLTFRGVAPAKGRTTASRSACSTSRAAAKRSPSSSRRSASSTSRPAATTEAGIHATWRGDLYVVLGDELKDGGYSVRLYFNPLVRLIWLGALIMFFGGALVALRPPLARRRAEAGAGEAAQACRGQ